MNKLCILTPIHGDPRFGSIEDGRRFPVLRAGLEEGSPASVASGVRMFVTSWGISCQARVGDSLPEERSRVTSGHEGREGYPILRVSRQGRGLASDLSLSRHSQNPAGPPVGWRPILRAYLEALPAGRIRSEEQISVVGALALPEPPHGF